MPIQTLRASKKLIRRVSKCLHGLYAGGLDSPPRGAYIGYRIGWKKRHGFMLAATGFVFGAVLALHFFTTK